MLSDRTMKFIKARYALINSQIMYSTIAQNRLTQLGPTGALDALGLNLYAYLIKQFFFH